MHRHIPADSTAVISCGTKFVAVARYGRNLRALAMGKPKASVFCETPEEAEATALALTNFKHYLTYRGRFLKK
jgi:hypothetical protein